MYLARFRIYTPCWQIGCAISTIDTIGIERRRGYANPEGFTVNYAVTNHSAEKGARIVHARIEIPAGLELVAGSPQQPMIPSELASGMTAACSWRVRVADPEGLIDSGISDTALIRCRVFYVDPESGQTYPMGEELCEHDIMVVAYDEPDPELVCTVEGPPELYWRGDGFAATPGGKSGAIRYRFTLTNLERDTITITDIRYRAGPECRIAGDSLRSGVLLAPGASYTDEIDIRVDALRYGRRLRIEAAALDEYGVPLSLCLAETDAPGVTDMPCTVKGPEHIVWNTATGTATPAVLPLTLLIDNPLDTIRRDVTLRADLSRAPHLAPAAGESLQRDPFFIIAHFRRAIDWQFVLADAPDTHVRDTLVFVYEEEGTEYRCEHVVEIRVIDKSVICTLTGTDTLSVADMLARTPGRLHITLTNAGTVAVDVERTELTIVPATGFPFTGLLSLDPLSRQGGSIDPGNDFTIDWNLRALIRRESRMVECTVTAFDANDNALATCTREIFLEGLAGLLCALTPGDSVRFNRTELRYDPEEAAADFKLENLLDTEETNIEAVIDLTQAPRFVLAPSESAGKIIAVVDSHSTAQLTWRLIPQPAPRAEDQDIIVRYRSDQMSAWKECRATIFIESWPEEMSVACATGGHDSLYADLHDEQFIPDPLHVSYTVTNTGTVALTGCEAAIILPPEFVLAGSDSIQHFTAPESASEPGGPVPEGTLLLNTSCTRWWKITPTPALADTDPRQIQWQWRSAEQGTEIDCERTIHIVPGNPAGIVLTPLHLYFEAERGGVPPAEQLVQLSTGGGLAMPWTAQTSAWWLNAQPASGSQSGQIAVQPNSAMLDEGAHDAEIHFAATPSDRHVAVTYVIRKSTGVNGTPASESFTLDVWPLPVPSGTRLHLRIGGPPGERCHLTLHDLLGRERLARYVESNQAVSIDIASTRLSAGVYVLRAVSEHGAQAMRMISVLR
ncbi:MAG: T9SS type A sorting domain-containing protein [Bacteroidetes bacterium]|nr:T9SS type A sorting domain-containing protein [Bacteroidota bacterium]